MLLLQNISYTHPDKEVLFENINLSIYKQNKIALIGNNGTGKSTLLEIIAGRLQPSSGHIKSDTEPYYIPQLFGQYNDLTIAEALRIETKLNALKAILNGLVTEENMISLNDDWSIEERCKEALSHWNLDGLDLSHKMSTLSGGQKTKVFLAGISIHQPAIVLLDEPSNHLDLASRAILYNYIQSTTNTLVVVSHDRKLLNLLTTTCELSKHGITVYGGKYDFYVTQKAIEADAFEEDLKNKEKALRKAKEIEKASLERQRKLDARGKKKQEKAGVPTILMNTLRNNAEKSTSRIKDVHAEKIDAIAQEVNQLRKAMPDKDKIKIGFEDSTIHDGKILVTAKDITYSYNGDPVWKYPLSFQITGSKRMAFKGPNGSGKTTLIKVITNELQPLSGSIYRAENKIIYIDQDYSLIDNSLTIYEQAQQYNIHHLEEHEVKSRLTHFLFIKTNWDKSCSTLSGGEKMRLILCCLTLSNQEPDIIIMDEPTNNLDIQNIVILTHAINDYKGSLIVVSHDVSFLEEIDVEEIIDLDATKAAL